MKAVCLVLAMTAVSPAAVAGEKIKRADPSSAKSVVLAFRDAVLRRDWAAAERCLASELRSMLKDAIADRSFFEQYVAAGFSTKTLGLLPVNLVTDEAMAELERLDKHGALDGPPGSLPHRIVVTLGHGGGACPWIAQCALLRENGGWKLSTHPRLTKREDFLKWYDEAIPKHARGQAKALEGKPGQPAAEPAPKPGGPLPQVPEGFPGNRTAR